MLKIFVVYSCIGMFFLQAEDRAPRPSLFQSYAADAPCSSWQSVCKHLQEMRYAVDTFPLVMHDQFQTTWTLLQEYASRDTVHSNADTVFTTLVDTASFFHEQSVQNNTLIESLIGSLGTQHTVADDTDRHFKKLDLDRNLVYTLSALIGHHVIATDSFLHDLETSLHTLDITAVGSLAHVFQHASDSVQEVTEAIANSFDEYVQTMSTFFLMEKAITQAEVNARGGQYTIAAPGTYYLAEDIVAPAESKGALITISSSDVVFTMAGKTLRSTAQKNLSGIFIADNLSNITVQNGIISTFPNNGITVSGGVSHLTIDHVTTVSCGRSGFFLMGQTHDVVNPLRDVFLTHCVASQCGWVDFENELSMPLHDAGMHAIFCERLHVAHSSFSNNTSQFITGGVFVGCSHGSIQDSVFNGNSGDIAFGLELIAGVGMKVVCCSAEHNKGVEGAAGFVLRNSRATLMMECTAGSNSGQQVSGFACIEGYSNSVRECRAFFNTGDGEGFGLLNEKNSVFYNCISLGNTAFKSASIAGFHTFAGENNHFQGCRASHNKADSVSAGFRCTGESGSLILNCQAEENVSSYTCAYGIFIEHNSLADRPSMFNCIQKNTVIANQGHEGGFGIFDDAVKSSSNVVLDNIGLNNRVNFSVTYPTASLPLVQGGFSATLSALKNRGVYTNSSISY